MTRDGKIVIIWMLAILITLGSICTVMKDLITACQYLVYKVKSTNGTKKTKHKTSVCSYLL
uniref:Uncharacterized protein n=1 Tax=Anguilla anguilla TaxID=7936 RepID=A0A0E9Q774_ANGAN